MSLEISKPATARYFIARNADGSVLHTGRTDTNQVTTTGLPFLEDLSDDQEYLAAAAVWADKFPQLPSEGAPVEAGQIYRDGDTTVLARQSHTRTSHDPGDVPALFSVARAPGERMDWIANEWVMTGDERAYASSTYTCLQSHMTQADWTPPSVPALWAEVVTVPDPTEWAPGQAVSIGDLRVYQGVTYRCIQAHTTLVGWHPPVVPALWEAV